MIQKTTTALLSLLLIGQLVSLEPHFGVGSYEVGNYSKAVPAQVRTAPRISVERLAELASSRSVEHRSLVFVGDVLLARNVEYLLQTKGEAYPYEGVDFAEFGAKSAVIGNFESTIPEVHEPTPAKHIRFSTDSKWLSALRAAGFTHFSLANNHTDDFAEQGFLHTQHSLRTFGFSTLNEKYNHQKLSLEYLEVDDISVAVISCSDLSLGCAEAAIQNVFFRANLDSDLQVAYVHWGEEYEAQHNKRQEQLAVDLVSFGADLIVGHHPHVVQDVGLIDSVPVFYSLGNYIFDQYFSTDVQQGLLLQVTFDGIPKVHLVPVTSEASLSQPRVMATKLYQKFLHRLAKRSDQKLFRHITQGVIPLSQLVATSTKTAMIDQ